MVKALARAFRWRKQLDTGRACDAGRLGQGEGRCVVVREPTTVRLKLLAPEIAEAIIDGRQSAGLQLDELLEGFPLEWERQRGSLEISGSSARSLLRQQSLWAVTPVPASPDAPTLRLRLHTIEADLAPIEAALTAHGAERPPVCDQLAGGERRACPRRLAWMPDVRRRVEAAADSLLLEARSVILIS